MQNRPVTFAEHVNHLITLPRDQWQSYVDTLTLDTFMTAAGMEYPLNDTELETFAHEINKEVIQDLQNNQKVTAEARSFLSVNFFKLFNQIPYAYNKPTAEEELAHQQLSALESQFLKAQSEAVFDLIIRSNLGGNTKSIAQVAADARAISSAPNPFVVLRSYCFGLFHNRPLLSKEENAVQMAAVRELAGNKF